VKEHLLLIPGIDGTGELFYRQIPSLERDFTVTATRHRDDAATMDELVADLHEQVERIAPAGGRVTLLGESFGGALTLSYALAHPDRIDRLVILNSFAHFGSPAQLWVGYQLLRATPWGMMHYVRRLNARRMHSPQTERDEIRRFHELMRNTTRQGYLSRLRILRDYDIRMHLPSIGAPVLYLAADRDTLVPSVEQARLMSELTPGGTMRILAGHGHSCLIAPDIDLGLIVGEWRGRAAR
jgi:pimeloyl-ACP methyl ester carboxylesterase